jgi:Cu+-exporting ATPase
MMQVLEDISCYHCGQTCENDRENVDDKTFCCYGCKVVYELISDNQLCDYYEIDSHPGIKTTKRPDTFAYLDEKDIRKKVLEFDSTDFARVRLNVPAIHCASCIWLLENLHKVDRGIFRSEVNFNKKTVVIDYNPARTNLSTIVSRLDAFGYTPRISTDQGDAKPGTNFSLLLKLGVAGFCFGNIMLFSFPEYLGLDGNDKVLGRMFSWINLGLAIPVFFFSGWDYLRSAFKSFSQKRINIDVPIALGFLALFLRSSWDIISDFGPGYLDSFSGLVFFLLIGRWFQDRTYENLAFDRDFKSYFPLAVQRIDNGIWTAIVIFNLRKGDQIKVRNLEIIPSDSILLDRSAFIDYSFVTGEARPVKAYIGDMVYAGGRLIGEPAELTVEDEVSQSKLTSLWNNQAFRKTYESKYKKIIDRAAMKFTWIVLGIASLTAAYWYIMSPSQMWLVLTSVLMVACPCALALAAPFTYGSMLRVFGNNNFYLKNADVVERLASIDQVIFDKTGTVTHGSDPKIVFEGELSARELGIVKVLTGFSTHPLSTLINNSLTDISTDETSDFMEIPSKGIEGRMGKRLYRIGSASFTGFQKPVEDNATRVFVSIDGEVRGCFVIQVSLRNNIAKMLQRLGKKCFGLVSGDNEGDKELMSKVFPATSKLFFGQTPSNKIEVISNLQKNGYQVMMVGDGLNDAGALKQSDVGIAVTDNTGLFTPACDGILNGDQLDKLDTFLSLARSSTSILKAAFTISFLYNGIALSFAVTGHLTPLVAAILMPVSSISVVGFASIAVNYVAYKKITNTKV